MRRVLVHVAASDAIRVAEMASHFDGTEAVVLPAHRHDGAARSVVMAYLPNRRLESFAEEISEHVSEALIAVTPHDVLPIPIPFEKSVDLAGEISHTSSVELIIGALQSIGSWTNLLLYAVFSGIIAAYAVIFDIGFLLVAAMLIAPMGAPVMVCVVGAAIGDAGLFTRGALRFFVAVALLILTSLALGAVYGYSFTSSSMDEIANLSGWVILVALVGGGAGALSQIASERNSLVSASTTGFLVAVALSPTSAVLGLALLIGRWEYVSSMALVILLTFAGIVAGGALMLAAMGTRRGTRGIRPGSKAAQIAFGAILAASIVGLVLLQQSKPQAFTEADLSRRAVQLVRSAGEDLSGVRLLDVSAAYVSGEDSDERAMLIRAVIARTDDTADIPHAEEELRRESHRRLEALPADVRAHVLISTVP